MKKFRKVCLIVIILLLMIVPIYQTRADSGFDGSYDFGGGDYDWGDSDWGYDSWDDDDDYYSGSSSGSYGDSWIILVWFILIMIIISAANANNRKNVSKQSSRIMENTLPVFDINKIKEVLPDFNLEEFRNKTYQIYQDIQVAWMNFDTETIKKLVTDEMFNMYNAQLTTLKVKGEINVMKDFYLTKFRVIGMEHTDDLIAIDVFMQVECYDYIEKNGVVSRGNQNRKVVYNYKMTFNKGLAQVVNKCPNCGAELDNNVSSVCPYCRSKIINDNYDWVLAKKQVIDQWFK